jgi:rubredoxin
MEDYDIDNEVHCPKCGHSPLHNRFCTNFFCEDGYIDESEDDPINFMPGESERACPECKGTGVEWWCPKCGTNLSGNRSLREQFEKLNEEENY